MTRQLIKLPNLGNTCYINTALQVLLINNSLKKKLHFHKDNLNGFYKILFHLFYNGDNQSNKKLILEALMTELKLKNEQGDSHEVLLKFIELLENSGLHLLKDEYTFTYSIKSVMCTKCKEPSSKQLMDISSWISYTDFIEINTKHSNEISCDKCKATLLQEINIIVFPRYLIFYPLEKSLQLEININNKIKYKLKMLNVFIGLDNIGHYYNIYKTKDIWIKIDDNTVSKIPDIKTHLKNKLLRITSLVYKKIKSC
jgi:ubiquitin C-terminal hydrolase